MSQILQKYASHLRKLHKMSYKKNKKFIKKIKERQRIRQVFVRMRKKYNKRERKVNRFAEGKNLP